MGAGAFRRGRNAQHGERSQGEIRGRAAREIFWVLAVGLAVFRFNFQTFTPMSSPGLTGRCSIPRSAVPAKAGTHNHESILKHPLRPQLWVERNKNILAK